MGQYLVPGRVGPSRTLPGGSVLAVPCQAGRADPDADSIQTGPPGGVQFEPQRKRGARVNGWRR